LWLARIAQNAAANRPVNPPFGRLAPARQLRFNCCVNANLAASQPADPVAARDGRPGHVTVQLHWTVLLGVGCTAVSWFALDSLVTDLRFARLGFRFYNVLTLMRSPDRILSGPGEGGTLDAWLFGAVCAVCLLAALAPLVLSQRRAWLGCVAPFALMVVAGAVLYHGFTQDFIADSGSLGDTGSQLIRFANSLASQVGNVVARRVHVGAGGYLGLAATAVLAVKGIAGYRNP
jgi:hypothetical protein